MTTMQINAELFRLMSVLANDENSMKRVLKYLKKLVAQKEADDALMTKEEFFAKVDRGLQQVKEGKTVRMNHGETLEELLARSGYAIHD